MKSDKSLLELYKFNKKWLINMPIIAVISAITAIVFFIVYTWWAGLIFLGIAVTIIVIYLLILRYYNKKIKELENKEALKSQNTDN